MPTAEAQRTLVKSPPELWTELSDPVSLARHLGDVGEICIARVEPESKVEWEAEAASGTVLLKPSGWGTKVTLTIDREAPQPVLEVEPEPDPDPQPAPSVEPPAPERHRWLAKLFRRRRAQQPTPEPEPQIEAETAPSPSLATELAVELERLEATMAAQDAELLGAVLDRLGAAHHRPFSRG
jgi:hypothetical protein